MKMKVKRACEMKSKYRRFSRRSGYLNVWRFPIWLVGSLGTLFAKVRL